MFSQAILLSALVATTQARFDQEQVPIPAIQALSNFGQSGQAATLAGSSIGTLLAAADPCAKLKQADLIVSELGTDPQVISAAIGLVAAEQNFNPFVVSIPTICNDPTLPTTVALRGVVPLVDPAVGDSDVENANSATSKKSPFSNDGLSVAQVMVAQGFSNFTLSTGGSASSGAASGAAPAAATSPCVQTVTVTTTSSCIGTVTVTAAAAADTSVAAVASSAAADTTTAAAVAATSADAASSTSGAVAAGSDGAAGVAPGLIKSTIAGLDFGLCTPTIKFEAGLDGRADTEFTFQAQDPLVNKGQEEALNPNIITNRICDQLTNVCNANAAAKSACQTAKAQILALGTKDASTANAWNTALGFAGTNINPDNAPQPGLIGHD
ncbi:hypothetical protein OIDMADRAFT_169350 [Oidiodendron maius Zn]|uniref:Uncharacterized protein n=1 Tax=Oidiodendron maius (strain Zn) TaxID=913774 RepID=A0A0C3D6H2_OIDMZ|nr:hypothetical protein OIDMADRAFT_169350 [Oidiodendron maius Zn]